MKLNSSVMLAWKVGFTPQETYASKLAQLMYVVFLYINTGLPEFPTGKITTKPP